MTTFNKATLKTLFEQGDVPTGTNYADFIDSNVNLVETGEQAMAGPLYTTELITPRVSAANINLSGTVSAAALVTGDLAFVGNFAGVQNNKTFAISMLNGPALHTFQMNSVALASQIGLAQFLWNGESLLIQGDVSADSGTVYASAMRSINGFIGGTGIVSAAGTTQGAAAVLTNVINRGKGVVDGSTTGFRPLANRTGLTQYLYNEGASANLWPPTGGTINGLAANAVFPLAASAMVTIVHLTASAYAVK